MALNCRKLQGQAGANTLVPLFWSLLCPRFSWLCIYWARVTSLINKTSEPGGHPLAVRVSNSPRVLAFLSALLTGQAWGAPPCVTSENFAGLVYLLVVSCLFETCTGCVVIEQQALSNHMVVFPQRILSSAPRLSK